MTTISIHRSNQYTDVRSESTVEVDNYSFELLDEMMKNMMDEYPNDYITLNVIDGLGAGSFSSTPPKYYDKNHVLNMVGCGNLDNPLNGYQKVIKEFRDACDRGDYEYAANLYVSYPDNAKALHEIALAQGEHFFEDFCDYAIVIGMEEEYHLAN